MQVLINVDVDDLDEATHFYETAFGLKIGRRFGVDGVEMLGSSAPIYLLIKAEGTAASSVTHLRRSYGRHWTPVHLDFVVEEIELAVRQAVDAGARLESAVSIHKWVK
jgi:predicted enzyme related to lactoylglutathione lyase